jgi:hypothetical protein
MSKPDFKAMNWKELHTYFLAHREDQEAFYAYVDKLNALDTWVEMPPVGSPEELDNYPEFLERIRKSLEPRDKSA